MSTSALIYFIACHGGPAAHFSEFAKELGQNGYQVEILATGPAYSKLQQLGAREFNEEHLDIDDPNSQKILAERVANSLKSAFAVFTDVGHPLTAAILEKIGDKSPKVERIAYYDNPEPFVPGGYSETAAKVTAVANKVLFSNANLAKSPIYTFPEKVNELPFEKRIGVGYYPLEAAKSLEVKRATEKATARKKFFKEHKIVDQGQKILVYLGGNNEEYFEKALPAFLQILEGAKLDPSRYLILFQQHPGAKAKNRDGVKAEEQKLLISKQSTDDVLVFADTALYYQTSMGPQLVLAGIPAIQIGHATYEDILVRNRLAPCVTTQNEFQRALTFPLKAREKSQLLENLGVLKNWQEQLLDSLESKR